MAIPFAAMAANLGKIGGDVAGRGGGAFLGPLLSPITRASQYVANRLAPNLPPGPGQMMEAMLKGVISYAELYTAMKEQHGISFSNDNANASQNTYWMAVLEASKGQPDIGLAHEMWLRGAVDDADFRKLVKRNNIFDPRVATYLMKRSEQPTVDTILQWHRQGRITIDQARFWLEWLGWLDDQTNDLLLGQKTPLDTAALYQLVWRGFVTQDRFDEELKQAGYGRLEDRAALWDLRKLIPGPSDLARYAVRESWTQDVVDTFGYDSEFPGIFQYWMDQQGLGWETPAVTIGGVTYPSVSWPLAHWRAHWELPSPTQAYSFLQRARPTGGPNGGPRIPGLPAFDSAKLALLLKTKDYPPYFRPYLEAMSYRVMDVRSIRWAVKYGVFDQPEAVERYQDQGYNASTAEILAETDTRRFAEEQNRPIKRFADATKAALLKCILERYSLGGLSRVDAEQALAGQGVDQATVQDRLAAVDTCWDTAQLKLAVAAVRRALLGGQINWRQADERLAAAGITPESRELYRVRWQLQFTPKRKSLSTAETLDALERGYISRDEATARLSNIGWDQPDMVILYQTASRIVTERQMRLQEQEAAKAKKAADALKQAAREADAQHRRIIADLNRIEPIAMLKRLAKKGELSIEYVTDSLAARDIPPSAIQHYLEDFYGVTPEQPAPPPVPTGGPG